jgi:hypothetical protein
MKVIPETRRVHYGFILLNGARPNEGTIKFGLWCLTPLSTMEK